MVLEGWALIYSMSGLHVKAIPPYDKAVGKLASQATFESTNRKKKANQIGKTDT